MKILVLMKQTFDTEEEIFLVDGKLKESGVKYVINPYDEYAVEQAILLKEQQGAEVTVVTAGPARAEEALRTAVAVGADNAILLDEESLNGDEYTISNVLAAIAQKESYDLILAGHMSVDDGAAQIGPRVAELLGIPHISTITGLTIDGQTARAEKDVEGDLETIEVQLPALLTAQQGLNEPRYPTLPGIMKAKKKPIERVTAADLGIDVAAIGSKTETLTLNLPQKKSGGRILEGELHEQTTELVNLLRNEAKVV
ncbi:MAG: electron transfer flavoprotein subunit beta/FixA family protein [Caryophanon sp.]|nr:electron transfer flavoprotein subunit beta/FixA family protein [Caryophanon sp.]